MYLKTVAAIMKLLCFGVLFIALLRPVAGNSDKVSRFHQAERDVIVDTHNDLRRSIFNAANMRELTWNHSAAHAAAEWGKKCDYINRPDNIWGQNMNYFHGNEMERPPLELFIDSFYGWANETMHYDYRRFSSCGRKNVCSYVQLIAAEVQQVGCTIVQCPRLQLRDPEAVQENAKVLLCFYTPWVNILEKEVFIPHSRCSACPQGTRCVNNLCSAETDQDAEPLTSLGEPTVNIAVRKPDRSRLNRRRNRNRNRQRLVKERDQSSAASSTSGVTDEPKREPNVVFVSNNHVEPFPGRDERREVRRLGKYQRYLDTHRQRELVQRPGTVVVNATEPEVTVERKTNSSSVVKTRNKRQTWRSQDPRYYRHQEYERRLRERRLQRERELQRRADEERRRRQEAQRRRRAQALRRLVNEGELTSEEQFYTISAHNLLRRERGARELTWSNYLERWAKYVIRCDTEYPGPITCHTNFGKADQSDAIYNLVYAWGAEGNDVRRPMRYGCRTPYDRTRCNHNTIIRNPDISQMACAAKACGSQRQLTCIYNSG